MKKIELGDPATHSAELVPENVEKLRALFPDAFTERKIDFEVLKQLLGGAVEEREEKYGLNWHGKRAARQLALTPSTGTLRPCPEDSVDWDTTQNLMIEGDNLEVLKLLQKSYAGKVKLIYIDPPYNTGKDFVYKDDYRDNIRNYLEMTGQVDGDGRKVSANTEASGRFHTDWLNMMYPRLRLARSLLREDGLIAISLDDSEANHLKALMDEVFGEDAFVAQLVWKNKYNAGALTRGFSSVHEYLFVYSKGEIENITVPMTEEALAQYKGRDSKFPVRGGYVTQPLGTTSKDERPNLRFPIQIGGKEIWPEQQWIWSRDRVKAAIENDEVVVNEARGKISVRVKQYAKDDSGTLREMKPTSILLGPFNQEGSTETDELMGDEVFQFPKPTALVRWLLSLTVNDSKGADELILDFFAGSGTTAQAVFEQNADGRRRRFILVQLPQAIDTSERVQANSAKFCDKLGKPRNIAELTKERLRRAGKKVKSESPLFSGDLGFRVFKLDASNVRTWEPDREDVQRSIEEAQSPIKPGRSEADLLFELLLKLGLGLTAQIDQKQIAGKRVYSVGAGTLMACLAEAISREDIEPLARGIVEWHEALAPAGEPQFVFRDDAFADDVAKTNLTQILLQAGIEEDWIRSL